MKKILLAAAVMVAISTPTLAGDTLFGGIGDLVMKGRNAMRDTVPTTVQALEADGGNLRLYSWTPSDNPSITCWFAAGTQKGGGGCYPKGTSR